MTKVKPIKSGAKAGNGFKPLKLPVVAKLCKLTTAIATTYKRKIAKTTNIMISSLSALNFNFMTSPSFKKHYNMDLFLFTRFYFLILPMHLLI